MPKDYRQILEAAPIEASAPCRIDMGGTLDIRTFYLPLRQLNPCTVNIAIGLRTRVRIHPYTKGQIKISSTGFESVAFPEYHAPFNHPLGLMFAIATYFGVSGIHIHIDSASPPRSALGGSSAAAVALTAALDKLVENPPQKLLKRKQVASLAHSIEESAAGVPCGFQDQLAASCGGINAWYWDNTLNITRSRRKILFKKSLHGEFTKHILLAYCGIPHESKRINQQWVDRFIAGDTRTEWKSIVNKTHLFVGALELRDYRYAGTIMNQETDIRRSMTPDVLDKMGIQLIESARNLDCGARFTGAGGGGCIWAIGESDAIDQLRNVWQELLTQVSDACLLPVQIDSEGLIVH
jgi:D-glycero-alpha-D-manno-heptose-7-phosphate kinase